MIRKKNIKNKSGFVENLELSQIIWHIEELYKKLIEYCHLIELL